MFLYDCFKFIYKDGDAGGNNGLFIFTYSECDDAVTQ